MVDYAFCLARHDRNEKNSYFNIDRVRVGRVFVSEHQTVVIKSTSFHAHAVVEIHFNHQSEFWTIFLR